jgi:segregation and condensation protein B
MTDTTNETSLRLLEALLFASGEPLTEKALQGHIGPDADVPSLLAALKEQCAGRGVNLVQTDGLWSFRTAHDLAPMMKITRQPKRRLPKAAAEVLAIIAYHQPITRSEIESIRGVETSRGTLDILLELGWIQPGRPRETPGRPLTWKTTPEFLSHFNLTSRDELPGIEELKAAGFLDARPVLADLPHDSDEGNAVSDTRDEEEFAAWIKDEPEAASS